MNAPCMEIHPSHAVSNVVLIGCKPHSGGGITLKSSRRAIDFLRGTGRSASGYTHAQILGWDDDSWESEHDFIQWVFPTDIPSRFNPEAPTLDAGAIGILRADPEVQANLGLGLERFLGFLGLTRGPAGIQFAGKVGNVWLHENHNWLRVSRCLRCLTLLGRQGDAAEFHRFLAGLSGIPDRVRDYWSQALSA